MHTSEPNRKPILVFRLIHLDPALTMAMAFLARRCEARMGLVLAVHVKGFGVWLRCSIHSSIAASSSATLWKMPRRMRWRVISAKSRSTRLSHELDVGVKCSLKRLCRASQRFTFSVLCRGVIVDDQMQIEMGGRLAVDLPQERQEFVRPVAWQTFADDLASRHIKRGEERCRAVALVVVGHRASAALGRAGCGRAPESGSSRRWTARAPSPVDRDRGRRCPRPFWRNRGRWRP